MNCNPTCLAGADPCQGRANPRLCQLVADGREDYAAWLRANPVSSVSARSPDAPPLPSLGRQLLNAAESAAQIAASGGAEVAPEVLATRLAICRGGPDPAGAVHPRCPHHNGDFDACSLCGCPLASGPLGGKARWAAMICPDRDAGPRGRWPR